MMMMKSKTTKLVLITAALFSGGGIRAEDDHDHHDDHVQCQCVSGLTIHCADGCDDDHGGVELPRSERGVQNCRRREQRAVRQQLLHHASAPRSLRARGYAT
ncbi:unnamed protein product [Bathycoccus prasinos]